MSTNMIPLDDEALSDRFELDSARQKRGQRPTARDVFVRRRLFCIFLPFVVLGMGIYLYSFTLTTTINGGSVLGFIIAGAAVLAAARDAKGQ